MKCFTCRCRLVFWKASSGCFAWSS